MASTAVRTLEDAMTTATLTERDLQLRDAVMRQLESDQEVDAGAVDVHARAGSVTLTGCISTHSGKLAAERAARRVRGVRAVANDIDVRPKLERSDADIVADIVSALELRSTIPITVQATVHGGHVTLSGTADWMFQRRDAEDAVRPIPGVREVVNHITITARAVEREVRHRITEALHRTADLDARHISVAVSGDTAILTGTVSTWTQLESAEKAATDAPGIARVDNRIVVRLRYMSGEEVPDGM